MNLTIERRVVPGSVMARERELDGPELGEGGAYLNNERVEDPELVPGEGDLLGGSWLVLRRGKKNFSGVEVSRG